VTVLAGTLVPALLALAEPPACTCPCPPPATNGTPAPLVHVPAAAAHALNREGRDLYRQRRWPEARAKYRAALAADPAFVAPRLNLATAFAQDERFADAVAEAAALMRQAFVPWAREVDEAADLAPLAARPEKAALVAARAGAAAAWGTSLAGALLLLARSGPPVRLPPRGVLHLGLAQEIFAYLPHAGGYRQVTAEDGRVLAFLRSADGRTVVYARAGRLVREDGPPRLRGLALVQLDLPTMSLGPAVLVPGDVERLVVSPAGSQFHVQVSTAGGDSHLRFDGRALLASAPAPRSRRGPGFVVTGQGSRAAGAPADARAPSGCRYRARDLAAGSAGVPQVEIAAGAGARFRVGGPHGAALTGLPFP
jgi:hypothetical protein